MTHVRVLDTSVDLNFTHKLLFSSALCQTRLLNDFARVNKSCLGINEFITFGKATLAKELAFNVSADADLSVHLLILFLYNVLRGLSSRTWLNWGGGSWYKVHICLYKLFGKILEACQLWIVPLIFLFRKNYNF